MTDEIIQKTPQKLASAVASWSWVNMGGDQYSPEDIDRLETFDIKKYNKVIDLCRFFYRKDPIAGTVINKMTEIGITNLIFDKGKLSENEFRIFESMKDSLQEFAEVCGLEYLISGLVVPEASFDAVSKETVTNLGIKKYTTLTLPTKLWLRDPKTIEIKYIMILEEPSYYVILPEELVYFISNNGTYPDGSKDLKLYEYLTVHYPEFVESVRSGNKKILLENDLIVRRKPLTDNPYPTPYLYNALEAMKHKRNLRRMDYSIASRVITAIQLVKLGSDDFPVTQEDENEDPFAAIKEQMAWRNSSNRDTERIFQLFANHTLSIEWIYPDVSVLLDDKKYTTVNQDIFLALGFPKILTTGETERTQTSDPEFASISPVETMKNMQKKILSIIKGIVKEISKKNGLKYIPEVRFENINLHSFTDFVSGMKALYDTANISRTSFAKAFGFNWGEEVKTRSEENDKLEELGVEEFAPMPFSPNPNKPQNTDKKPKPKSDSE